MRQKASRVARADQGLVGEIGESDGFSACQAVVEGDHQHARFVVEDGHVQLCGLQRQPGHHGVHAAVQQSGAHLVPREVRGVHVGIRMPVAQLAYRGGNDDVRGVADGDAGGLGRGPGESGSSGSGAQQRLGVGQEDFACCGEPTAVGGAVQQPGSQLLLQAADLPAQRWLGEVKGIGGAGEGPVFSEGDEVPQ